MAAATFDLFLSYNHADEQTVREVHERLAARGVRSFIDQDDLTPGKTFPAELERALQNSRAVAVFVGRSGFGRWQWREIQYALVLQTESDGNLVVVPVILEGAKLPAGFIAMNTWVDLRRGIDEAAIERLVRAIRTSTAVAAPPADINPYRRLDAFREEDASLFFGRQFAIDAVVSKIDEATGWDGQPRLITVTGPSGSGKSSVVNAGVLPRLRSRRPPRRVWDAAAMQPRRNPWQSLASVLIPFLDPTLTEVDRLHASATLAAALCGKGGIITVIERIFEKSCGTDRLLVVVDQFEELFTQSDESTARDFVRALLDASRNAPLSILATLRSDYYGKAIALDRDLSDALPCGQVNLGPMRRDELRDIIVGPATMVEVVFEAGLVERILDDVGDEPGNLPLLEYALSELWDLRAQSLLTFSAYQDIGGVAGALTRRAETIYGELSEAQKHSSRRLLMRLVRVSPADEEGADTRRRARRDEIGDEDWKLVHAFAGERARLVVAGTDPVSGEDGVEVAHEALIRRWDRLREWLNDDRDFLLWRQDLALYRAGSPEGLPQGTLLTKASAWLRHRSGELNIAERVYINKSLTAFARTQRLRITVAVATLIAMVVIAAWITYSRTARYDVQTILRQNPEAHFARFNRYGDLYEINLSRTITLVRLGRYDALRRAIASQTDRGERANQLARLAVAMHAVAPRHAGAILQEAISEARGANYGPAWRGILLAQMANAAARIGDSNTAVELLQSADTLLPFADATMNGRVWCRREVAAGWRRVSRPEHARKVLRPVLDLPLGVEGFDTLSGAVEELVRLGESDIARNLPSFTAGDEEARPWYELMRLRAYAVEGNMEKAQEIAGHLPKNQREQGLAIIAKHYFARYSDLNPTRMLIRTARYSADSVLLDYVIGDLVRQKRDNEVEQLIAEAQAPAARRDMCAVFIQHLINAGRLDAAARVAEHLKSLDPTSGPPSLPFALLGAAYAREGRKAEAEDALRYAVRRMPALLNESDRDEVDAVRALAEAILGRFHEARRIADGIEGDDWQWDAYFAILATYVSQRKSPQPPIVGESAPRLPQGNP